MDRTGYDYARKLQEAIEADLSDVKNKLRLDALYYILPYMAVKFSDAELKQIEEIISKIDADRAGLLTKREDKAEELNRITLIKKEQAVAIGGIKT
jgi:hypothetical protein